jgi:hypothetical protein
MAVVSTMILRSMRMIGEKHRGGTLSSAEQTETLDEFNTFLEALSVDKLMCYTVTQDSHLLTVSTASYTIGPGATIDTTRPTKLVEPCWVRDSTGYDYPLKVISLQTYGRLTDKSLSASNIPQYIYYDAGFSATSTATLTVYPAPSVGLTLFIHSLKQFSSVSTQSVNLALPPGYRLFLEANFAIHLAAGQTPVSAEVAKIAKDTMARIKQMNAPEMIMQLESGARIGMTGDHNIYVDGEYVE